MEVKAHSGTLELSSNSNQILGELEVLSASMQAIDADPYFQAIYPPVNSNTLKNAPVLFFVTTDDTQIGQSIINEARNRGINIWQSKAIYDPATNQLSFSSPRIVYSKDPAYPPGTVVPKDLLLAITTGPVTAQVTLGDATTLNFDVDPETIE